MAQPARGATLPASKKEAKPNLRLPSPVLRLRDRLRLPPDDLLRDATYRRLFGSILVGSFGTQMSMLALPLAAAVLLQATPTQMGTLAAMEVLPFALFSLPTGVFLDRVRKLPVYVAGESALAQAKTDRRRRQGRRPAAQRPAA